MAVKQGPEGVRVARHVPLQQFGVAGLVLAGGGLTGPPLLGQNEALRLLTVRVRRAVPPPGESRGSAVRFTAHLVRIPITSSWQTWLGPL